MSLLIGFSFKIHFGLVAENLVLEMHLPKLQSIISDALDSGMKFVVKKNVKAIDEVTEAKVEYFI